MLRFLVRRCSLTRLEMSELQKSKRTHFCHFTSIHSEKRRIFDENRWAWWLFSMVKEKGSKPWKLFPDLRAKKVDISRSPSDEFWWIASLCVGSKLQHSHSFPFFFRLSDWIYPLRGLLKTWTCHVDVVLFADWSPETVLVETTFVSFQLKSYFVRFRGFTWF